MSERGHAGSGSGTHPANTHQSHRLAEAFRPLARRGRGQNADVSIGKLEVVADHGGDGTGRDCIGRGTSDADQAAGPRRGPGMGRVATGAWRDRRHNGEAGELATRAREHDGRAGGLRLRPVDKI